MLDGPKTLCHRRPGLEIGARGYRKCQKTPA
jgi:hypothetical protein